MAGHPSSKGKVEIQMKLLDEIHAYQGKLTLEELNEKIQQINLRKNMDIHSGTGKSPITLGSLSNRVDKTILVKELSSVRLLNSFFSCWSK